MTQIERIAHMEQLLDQAADAVARLDAAWTCYSEAKQAIEELEAYYTGGRWLRDYLDDSAGKLPPEMKRGVLSQDALYHLFEVHDCLVKQMKML